MKISSICVLLSCWSKNIVFLPNTQNKRCYKIYLILTLLFSLKIDLVSLKNMKWLVCKLYYMFWFNQFWIGLILNIPQFYHHNRFYCKGFIGQRSPININEEGYKIRRFITQLAVSKMSTNHALLNRKSRLIILFVSENVDSANILRFNTNNLNLNYF